MNLQGFQPSFTEMASLGMGKDDLSTGDIAEQEWTKGETHEILLTLHAISSSHIDLGTDALKEINGVIIFYPLSLREIILAPLSAVPPS